MKRIGLIVGVALAAGMAGLVLGKYWTQAPDVPAGRDKYLLARVGDYRPGFSHGSTTGAIENIDDYSGQVVLLNFWATWCTPCRKEMPLLQEFQQHYAARGFQVIGIAMDDVARVREFVAELGIRYPNLVGAADVMETGLAYGNASGTLPYSVLIDRDGIIRWQLHGELVETTFRARLEQLL